MDFSAAHALRSTHPAWRLVAAGNAALIVSFFHRTFVVPNVRTLARSALVARLEDFLHDLRQQLGDDEFPRGAAQYVEDWARDEHGWLRKYYQQDDDEPYYDLTAASEKALGFVASLAEPQLISTESRLLTVFELLRQLTEGTSADADARIADLELRRTVIDADIARLRSGHVDLLDAAQVKDRFQQMATTARALLGDFRALDQSFRDLDRQVRERIATWVGGKGELLQDILGQRDQISDSDQGRSFRAFWDFLMSPARQEELTTRLERVLALEPVKELAPERRLLRIHHDWLEAGEVAQRTVARLSRQLRRYLDDRVVLENRRLMEILRGIEQQAVAVREEPPRGAFIDIDDVAPEVSLPLQRPLFAPTPKPQIAARQLSVGEGSADTEALYAQVYVDRAALQANIRRALQTRNQISLPDLVAIHPLELGLAELVTYMAIASDDAEALIDDTSRQQLYWVDESGVARQATVPVVVFTRPNAERASR
jgi:hypothetical protein